MFSVDSLGVAGSFRQGGVLKKVRGLQEGIQLRGDTADPQVYTPTVPYDPAPPDNEVYPCLDEMPAYILFLITWGPDWHRQRLCYLLSPLLEVDTFTNGQMIH